MSDPNHRQLVVLIDADNAQPSAIPGVLAEIAKFGTASVKRIYGDWTMPNLSSWKDVVLKHSLQPVQQFRYTVGKNATDSAMIIDAMDLLYTRRFKGFCLVSSDSDFTRLAVRIREDGLFVLGFGDRQKTAPPLIAACDEFHFVGAPHVEGAKSPGVQITPLKRPANGRIPTERLKSDVTLVALLRATVGEISDESGWAPLGVVGYRLRRASPEFSSGKYGYAKLSDLYRATDLFDLENRGTGDHLTYVRVRHAIPST